MFERQTLLFAMIAALVLQIMGCTLDDTEEEPAENTPDMAADTPADTQDDEVDPAEATWEQARGFLTQIETANYETAWHPMFEENSEPRPLFIGAKHPGMVAVYQNDIARNFLSGWEESEFPMPMAMPDGAMILKHNYATDEESGDLTHAATTIMIKDTSLNEADYPGQWFWIKANPDLTLMDNDSGGYMAGALKGCIDCHNGRTNFGAFPDPEDPMVGGQEDAHIHHDYVIIAYCRDPSTEACSVP